MNIAEGAEIALRDNIVTEEHIAAFQRDGARSLSLFLPRPAILK